MRDFDSAVKLLKKKIDLSDTALILGSGLGKFVDEMKNRKEVSYSRIPGFARSRVPGHSGKIVSGEVAGRKIIVLAGRIHFYEGHPMGKIVYMIDVLAALGVKKLIVTNAGGSIRRDFKVPSLVLLKDHINFMGVNPLRGKPNFVDLTDAYDAEYRRLILKIAAKKGMKLNTGVYLALSGPSYETKAEIRMFRKFGADIVGMSTVPEVIAAKKNGMRVIGISCVTNYACGVTSRPLSHEEVLVSGKKASASFIRLIRAILSSKEFWL